ncbi:TRAP transporter substrate-binding protein DctP [Dactylosporangium sp. NPDC005572]|uniref:TRAP transporter substrate-binding protein n=1 Tax=Dactylosporangium sp. NPDC005572 TaxID=3156889 RepID=UPI0033B6FF64
MGIRYSWSGAARIAGIALISTAALAGCGGGSGAGDGSVTIKLAIPTGPDAPIGQAAKFWAETLEKESGGRVRVDIFDSGSLVPGTETLKATRDGRVGLGIVPNAYHPEELAALSVVATPYVTQKTVVDIAALNELAVSNKTLKAEFEELGVKPLFFVGNGGAAAVTKAPITSLADFKGKRFRALATTDTMVKPLGATGSFVEFADVYESIQRGVIDGAFPMDMGSAASASLNEVAPYLTVTGQGTYTVSVGIVAQRTYDSYPAAVKDAIERTNQAYNAWVPTAFAEYEAKVCDKLRAAGAHVSVLPGDQSKEWQDKTEAKLNELLLAAAAKGRIAADDFKALQDDYRKLALKYESTTKYEDGLTACATRAN